MVLKMLCCPATLMPLLLAVLLSVSATHAEEACSRDAMNACISDAKTAFGPAFGNDGTACNDSAFTEKVCEAFVDIAWCLIINECKYLENKTAKVFSTSCTVKQFEDQCLGNPIYRFKRQDETAGTATGETPAGAANGTSETVGTPANGTSETVGTPEKNVTQPSAAADPAGEEVGGGGGGAGAGGGGGGGGGGMQGGSYEETTTSAPPKSSGLIGAANPLVLLMCHVALLLAVLMYL